MSKEFWLICQECGYAMRVYSEGKVYENEKCSLCGGILILDLNKGKKIEPTGDNFPSFIKNGICQKDNMTICNLGYACDGCPYNSDNNIINKKGYIPATNNDFMNLKEEINFSNLPKITADELINFSIDLELLKGIDDLLKNWEKK